MERKLQIIESCTPPKNINVIWFWKGVFKYFDAGEWVLCNNNEK